MSNNNINNNNYNVDNGSATNVDRPMTIDELQTYDVSSLTEQLAIAQQQILVEKAGKRKLFHSLVKVANELRHTRNDIKPLLNQQQYLEQNWYEGGLWRAPTVLPTVNLQQSSRFNKTKQHEPTNLRESLSLSDLFFNLVIVTAFSRVGVSISTTGYLDARSILYFGIFWSVWSKEANYATRFDTTDLSAAASTLVTCFAVLFASLSVQAPINSPDGTRIMLMSAFLSALDCFLHIRVLYTNYSKLNEIRDQHELEEMANAPKSSSVQFSLSATKATDGGTRRRLDSNESGGGIGAVNFIQHVINYAVFNIIMTLLECAVWIVGIVVFPVDYKYRWCIFLTGLLLAQRMPRAFLANDFHAASSRRGVLFILLLGFLLQNIVVVSSDFFAYQTPSFEHYSFIGSACLMLYCIKLLYVDENGILAQDHALLVNRWAGVIFSVGQFILLLSTTVMGSGLNLLTHEYMAATAALPGPSKTLVCGGFSTVLFSTFIIKSMHVKRIPTDGFNQALFIGAYMVQAIVLLLVVVVTAMMSLGYPTGFLEQMMQYDSILLFALSGAAFVVVLLSWLDEAVELILYESAADSRQFLVHPFGICWCLAPDVTQDEIDQDTVDDIDPRRYSVNRLSVMSPLLGSSIANMRDLWGSTTNLDYQSMQSTRNSAV